MLAVIDFIPKNAIESIPPSFAGGFFCSLPIHVSRPWAGSAVFKSAR
jgi:hypothetical protein